MKYFAEIIIKNPGGNYGGSRLSIKKKACLVCGQESGRSLLRGTCISCRTSLSVKESIHYLINDQPEIMAYPWKHPRMGVPLKKL